MNERATPVLPLVVHVSEEVRHCELSKRMKGIEEAKSHVCCCCFHKEEEMLFRILFCLFFGDCGDFLFWMFQTQFGGVHGVVVVMGVVMSVVKWGANAVAGIATAAAAATGTAAAATGTGTCRNLQCDHFRRKCDIEWKASKDM